VRLVFVRSTARASTAMQRLTTAASAIKSTQKELAKLLSDAQSEASASRISAKSSTRSRTGESKRHDRNDSLATSNTQIEVKENEDDSALLSLVGINKDYNNEFVQLTRRLAEANDRADFLEQALEESHAARDAAVKRAADLETSTQSVRELMLETMRETEQSKYRMNRAQSFYDRLNNAAPGDKNEMLRLSEPPKHFEAYKVEASHATELETTKARLRQAQLDIKKLQTRVEKLTASKLKSRKDNSAKMRDFEQLISSKHTQLLGAVRRVHYLLEHNERLQEDARKKDNYITRLEAKLLELNRELNRPDRLASSRAHMGSSRPGNGGNASGTYVDGAVTDTRRPRSSHSRPNTGPNRGSCGPDMDISAPRSPPGSGKVNWDSVFRQGTLSRGPEQQDEESHALYERKSEFYDKRTHTHPASPRARDKASLNTSTKEDILSAKFSRWLNTHELPESSSPRSVMTGHQIPEDSEAADELLSPSSSVASSSVGALLSAATPKYISTENTVLQNMLPEIANNEAREFIATRSPSSPPVAPSRAASVSTSSSSSSVASSSKSSSSPSSSSSSAASSIESGQSDHSRSNVSDSSSDGAPSPIAITQSTKINTSANRGVIGRAHHALKQLDHSSSGQIQEKIVIVNPSPRHANSALAKSPDDSSDSPLTMRYNEGRDVSGSKKLHTSKPKSRNSRTGDSKNHEVSEYAITSHALNVESHQQNHTTARQPSLRESLPPTAEPIHAVNPSERLHGMQNRGYKASDSLSSPRSGSYHPRGHARQASPSNRGRKEAGASRAKRASGRVFREDSETSSGIAAKMAADLLAESRQTFEDLLADQDLDLVSSLSGSLNEDDLQDAWLDKLGASGF